MKTPTQPEAKRASEALHKLRHLLKTGKISFDACKEFGAPHAKVLDAYMKASARKAGAPVRGFSFSAFLR